MLVSADLLVPEEMYSGITLNGQRDLIVAGSCQLA
jgi:hypothetical protein